jgi:hypothetical protein
MRVQRSLSCPLGFNIQFVLIVRIPERPSEYVLSAPFWPADLIHLELVEVLPPVSRFVCQRSPPFSRVLHLYDNPFVYYTASRRGPCQVGPRVRRGTVPTLTRSPGPFKARVLWFIPFQAWRPHCSQRLLLAQPPVSLHSLAASRRSARPDRRRPWSRRPPSGLQWTPTMPCTPTPSASSHLALLSVS